MKKSITATVELDIEEIIHGLVQCDYDEIINFIKELDARVADWDFTKTLMRYFLDVVANAYIMSKGEHILVPKIPTAEMLEAGENTFIPTYTGTCVSSPGQVWDAMIKSVIEKQK